MSDTGNEQHGGDQAALLSHFECPVCLDYAFPPIPQCPNGHIVCSGCRKNISNCPTCRAVMGDIRNLTLEKLVDTVKFPCKYLVNGCTATMLNGEKAEHESNCQFKFFGCPTPDLTCKWQGSLPTVFNHLTSHNPPVTPIEGKRVKLMATEINKPDAGFWVMVQSCHDAHFLTVLEKHRGDDHDKFYASVKLIGAREDTGKYITRLELKADAKKLMWVGNPHSVNEDFADMKSNCLSFDAPIAENFIEGGNLGIIVTIVPKSVNTLPKK